VDFNGESMKNDAVPRRLVDRPGLAAVSEYEGRLKGRGKVYMACREAHQKYDSSIAEFINYLIVIHFCDSQKPSSS
jgi:hypothetical protein